MPTKYEARKMARKAIAQGKIDKPASCERCDQEPEPKNLHAHHDDYNRPLEVRFLCNRCHPKVHPGSNKDGRYGPRREPMADGWTDDLYRFPPGERLSLLVLRSEMKEYEFARKAGVKGKVFRDIAAQRYNPPVAIWARCAEALNVEIGDLVDWRGNPT